MRRQSFMRQNMRSMTLRLRWAMRSKRIRVPSRAVRRDHHLGAERLQPAVEMVRVIGLVGQQVLRRRDIVQDCRCDVDVGDKHCHVVQRRP